MTWKLSSKDKGSEYQSPMSLSEKQNEHPKYMLLAITNFQTEHPLCVQVYVHTEEKYNYSLYTTFIIHAKTAICMIKVV